MRNSSLGRSFVGRIPVLILACFIGMSPGESLGDTPDLDVVLNSTEKVGSPIRVGLNNRIRKVIGEHLVGLNCKTYALQAKPEDGAAPYRLLVRHSGRLSIRRENLLRENFKVKSRSYIGTERGKNKFLIVYDRTQYIRKWLKKTRQETRYRFELLRWEGKEYSKVRMWDSSKLANVLALSKDQEVEVAQKKYATPTGDKPPPEKCPLSERETYVKAAELSADDRFSYSLLRGFVDIKFNRIPPTKSRRKQRAVVRVKNLSPWKITRLTADGVESNSKTLKKFITRFSIRDQPINSPIRPNATKNCGLKAVLDSGPNLELYEKPKGRRATSGLGNRKRFSSFVYAKSITFKDSKK